MSEQVKIVRYEPQDHACLISILSRGIIGTWRSSYQQTLDGSKLGPILARLLLLIVVADISQSVALPLILGSCYEILVLTLVYFENGAWFVRYAMALNVLKKY
jgi:hypothetical protein